MAFDTKKGAAGDGARDDVFCCPAERGEITVGLGGFQRLDDVAADLMLDIVARRASWIARRYRLAPTMAAVVASLHFGEASL